MSAKKESTKTTKTSTRNRKISKSKKESVAIIGMSGFFPESDSVYGFWENLSNQKSLVKEIPDDHDPERSVRDKRGAFVKNLRGFDAKLFHIIGKEAKYMTPQQRLLLMSVWNLFEDACILPSALKNKKVAVIVGKEINPYMEYLTKASITAYTCLGMAQTYLPNRISNYFNFKGPSYCVNTSCSSGLTALHQGKKMLKNKEVDYVIVAGVSLIYGNEWTKAFFSGSESMGLMTSGKNGSRPFQNEASGFTPSEGVISFLLKRSDEALDDKDNIHAFILGSESSHVGGSGNIAFPDADQQSKTIIAAYKDAGIPPETITHIEAHGASAILADSQEIRAFKLADKYFGNDLKADVAQPCKISSLKPNIGHMHAASGLASMVRLIYSFKEQKKLGIKNFEKLSDEINLDKTRYYIRAQTEEWHRLIGTNKEEIPRRGAIHNSGGGGTNIHVVLEEYVAEAKDATQKKANDTVYFLALSSIDKSQFLVYAKSIKEFLERNSDCDEQQIEYHYLTSRKGLNHRMVFRFKSIENLIEKLNRYIKSEGKTGYYINGSSKEGTSLNEIFLKNGKVVQFLNDLNDKNDKSFLFDLWTKGYEEPIQAYYKAYSIPKTSLPGYPFKLTAYWLDIYAVQQTDQNKSIAINDELTSIAAHDAMRETVQINTYTTIESIQTQTEKVILSFISELLELKDGNISADEEIQNDGFNSLVLTELVNMLNEYFTIDILPTLFYSYPTAKKLAAFLATEYTTELAKKYKLLTKPAIKSETAIAITSNKEESKACGNISSSAKSFSGTTASNEPVAIVGMSCRFPGSPNPGIFWKNIKANKDLVTEVPGDRWDWRKYYGDSDKDNKKTKAKWGGFISDIDKFDPLHFKISPKEAELMDPQHRLALEEVYHAIEDAGINPESLSGTNTGIFIGSYFDDYATLIDRKQLYDSQVITGLSQSMLTNRISYLLDLKGPSETIDTACSSSLVAIRRGVENIRNGDCDIVIAGGISLILTPDILFPLSQAGFLSMDGRCKTFDESANGYVRSEGVGMIVLKSLSQAKKDGDQIYAVIRSVSENHGGKANTLTSPSPIAQKELLLKAYRSANIDPRDVGYIEAHGTGTPLGDPIETEALKLAFKELYKEKELAQPVEPHIRLGSVKANIGHLEPAAGIAGVLKVVLSLKHKTIPGNPHLKIPNEYLKLENSPFQLQTETIDWDTKSKRPRVAGVSSFGAGGSNAHVVLEEYVQIPDNYKSNDTALVLLSAKNKERLKDQVKNLANYLKENNTVSIYDLAYTLQVGREAMRERLAIIVSDVHKLKDKLEEYSQGKTNKFFTGTVKSNDFNQDRDVITRDFATAIKNESIEKLAQFWVKGQNIDWTLLYKKNEYPNKISLPVYPFARDRYWIPETKIQNIEQAQPAIQETKPEWLITLYKNVWEEIELESGQLSDGVILLINADAGNEKIAGILVKTLKQAVIVNSSDQTISYKDVSTVIDLGASLETDYKWAEVLQHVISTSEHHKIKLVHISRVGQVSIGKGLYQSLEAEYGKVSASCLELPIISTLELDKDAIIQVLSVASIPIRINNADGKWKTPKLHAFDIEKKDINIRGPILITGGTRGLGMACAKHLVTKHNVKQLILLGRERIPQREEWDILKKQNNALSEKINDFIYLEDSGAALQLLDTSLTDKQALKETFSKIREEWGAIKGLLHCAGIVDMETPAFINKTIETIQLLQEPKVTGLNNLYEVLEDHELNFGILFSSIAALVPRLGAGQCDYAMANAYLDSFAEVHRKEGYRSIQWPSWKETGMGEVTGGVYGNLGLQSLTNHEALSILDTLLSLTKEDELTVVAPIIYDPQVFKLEELIDIPKQVIDNNIEITKTDSSIVSNWVSIQISETLKLPSSVMELDTPFQEYGVDSILLADLIKQLEKQLSDVSLSPSIILEYPTVGMLSTYLIEHHASSLSKVLNKEVISEKQPEKVVQKEIVSKQESVAGSNEPIAVIGIGCHFPDADNVGTFWNNLKKGKDSIKEIPSDRWNIEEHYSPDKLPGKSYSKWGAFIEDIEYFDPEYFKIPVELASQIDPLERQWLEVSAEAIADAGYNKKDLWGKSIGVYAGARAGNFKHKITDLHKDFIVGTGQNFITAHLAHIYNLKGPNMVVDTACSSSLTAIDLAVKNLRQGETELALAGGVDILLDENPFIGLSTAEVLSIDGKTKTFDKSANGTGLGEGCGVLLLKRLKDAIASGDKIYGVIEGTALNNDGSTMGITTPNPKAQQELLELAISNGNIDRSTISYIEAHGTGTLIGDPIELKGITSVLSKDNKTRQACAVGSVKTNIGHLMSAAGAAGIIKTLLSISAGQLPPTLNCENPNPRFDFSNAPVYPVRVLEDWNGVDTIRRAGVSAFGLGGNNAHVILSNAGIPAANQVKEPFNTTNIAFDKKRYWPEEIKPANTHIEKSQSMEAYFAMHQKKEGSDWIFTFDMYNDHYILRDHKVHNVSIVPGVTYLDLILRCSKKLFGETFELSRILFIEPLATDKTYDRHVEVRFRKGRYAVYEAMIRSQRIDTDGKMYGGWSKHITCSLNALNKNEHPKMDIQAFIDSCDNQINMASVYKSARSVEIVHGKFMQTQGVVYQKDREELMRLNLSELSEPYRNRFYSHPAFLDGATFSGSSFHAIDKNQVTYIPFSIERFNAYSSLPSTIYVYSKHSIEKYNAPSEVIKSDIMIYDAKGNVLVEFKNLSIKRIRHAGLITNLLTDDLSHRQSNLPKIRAVKDNRKQLKEVAL